MDRLECDRAKAGVSKTLLKHVAQNVNTDDATA
jgi:hypothetical protein